MNPVIGPVSSAERIQTMDVVRGFALLGILLMNIVDFGMPHWAYMNPNIAGGATGPNLIAFILQYVLFEGKMRALFSMMFGAGVILLTTRGVERGGGIEVADIYYRRTLWLMLFGIAHAMLLWRGDILYPYAICGLFLFPIRKLPAKTLLCVAGVMFLLMTGFGIGEAFGLPKKKEKGEAAIALEKKGAKLTDQQKKDKEAWEKVLKNFNPPKEDVQKEIEAYRGGYLKSLAQRAGEVSEWHGTALYHPGLVDFYAFMLLGMAFVKLDVLTGGRPLSFYVKIAAAGYLIGIPMNATTISTYIRSGYEPITAAFAFSTYHLGRLCLALAHMSLLLIFVKKGFLAFLISRLAAVGQMAFSNYLSHSVICTLFFYGHGLGMFARLERHQLYFVVAAVWTLNLIWSPIWLRHFRFGPMEWCWRSLTYWQRQPMRIQTAAEGVPEAATVT